MELPQTRYADVLVLRLTGRIDHLAAQTFSQALAPHLVDCKAGGHHLLLDLSGLQYVSSAGLRVFMLAAKQTGPAGGRIAMAEAQPVMREILEISRFNMVFPLFGSLREGLEHLSPQAVAAYPG